MTIPRYYKIKPNARDLGDVIEELPFWRANAMKYIRRAGDKDEDPRVDLRKAIDCLQRELQRLDGQDKRPDARVIYKDAAAGVIYED